MKTTICFVCGREAPPTKGRGIREIMCMGCFKKIHKAFRVCMLCRYYKPEKHVGGRGQCDKRRHSQRSQVSILGACSKWKRAAGIDLDKHWLTKMLDLIALLPEEVIDANDDLDKTVM